MNEQLKTNSVAVPVALITGAARRIGAEITRTLHAQGYDVIIHCNHSEEDAKKLADPLNQARPASATIIKSDISTKQGCTALIEQALLFKNRLDALINNASIFYPVPINEVTSDQWHSFFETNLHAPFLLSQKASSHLKDTSGAIINITDIHGASPLPGYSVYSMTKAGLISMTQSLAKELAPEIRVNGVSPGAIMWPEADEGDDVKQQKVLAKIPLQRMGAANNISQTVLFLLQNDYITGQIIKVDGGRSC